MVLNETFMNALTELFRDDGVWFRTKLFPLVEEVMAGYNDPSHDILHVGRVVRVALELAEVEWAGDFGNSPEMLEMEDIEKNAFMQMVALTALCHDVGDHKYQDSERLKGLVFDELSKVMGVEVAEDVLEIGGHVSWSKEKREIREFGIEFRFPNPVHQAILSCVQDADRLDAIGAVGFARCVAFGAANGRQGFQRVIDHWHEKLKRIPDFMKTKRGHQRSEERVHELGTIIYALEREISCC